MAKKRSFEIGGINLRVHKRHHFEEYIELWRLMYRNRHTALYGNTAMMIGEARLLDKDDPNQIIVGEFYKFLNIDPDEPWFDIKKKKPADDEDAQKVSIPDYLKPNLKFVPYVFLPKKHRLYFISKSSDGGMAPSTVLKMLEKLTLRRGVEERFGRVDMTILTDRKAVEDLFAWKVIKTLEIFIERPNALEDEDEEDVLERLERLNAGSERIVLKKAPEAETLVPDERLKSLSGIAADHGEVIVSGKNANGVRDRASSKNFPMHAKGSYEPGVESRLQAIISFVMNRFL